MENPLRLYHTLVQVLRKHRNWLDIRHLKTLAWMMTGLIQSGAIEFCQSTKGGDSRYVDGAHLSAHTTGRRHLPAADIPSMLLVVCRRQSQRWALLSAANIALRELAVCVDTPAVSLPVCRRHSFNGGPCLPIGSNGSPLCLPQTACVCADTLAMTLACRRHCHRYRLSRIAPHRSHPQASPRR